MLLRNTYVLASLLASSALALAGCGSDDADAEGNAVGNCTIVDLGDGTSAIQCPDGSELVVQNGKDGNDGKDGDDGDDGAGCTLTEKGDGTFDLVCGGTTITLGDKCEEGFKADLVVGNPEDSSGPQGPQGPAGLVSLTSGQDLSFVLFEMTNCTWVRGDVRVQGYDGEELPSSLLRIERIDGDLLITRNPALERVSLPLLREVGGVVGFEQNDSLTEIADFPELVSAQNFVVWENPELQKVGDVPKLSELGYLDFYDNRKLATIGSFDELSTITETAYWEENPRLIDMGKYPKLAKVYEMYVLMNDALESIADFPALATIENSLTIEGNAVLTSIEGLSALVSVGEYIAIQFNPKLPQCQVDDFLDGITANEVYASDNDETATCP